MPILHQGVADSRTHGDIANQSVVFPRAKARLSKRRSSYVRFKHGGSNGPKPLAHGHTRPADRLLAHDYSFGIHKLRNCNTDTSKVCRSLVNPTGQLLRELHHVG